MQAQQEGQGLVVYILGIKTEAGITTAACITVPPNDSTTMQVNFILFCCVRIPLVLTLISYI